METQGPDIRTLFEPATIMVVGVSTDPTKVGYKVFDNILSGGYKGKLFMVNSKGTDVLGHKAHKSILEVPGPVDMAIICIPAKFVLDAVKDCASIGTKMLVVITSGFSEAGKTEEERTIVKFARENGMRVLGPNIFGLYSANSSMNATFGSKSILPGNVGILTQSGALGIAMIGRTAIDRIGLSTMVSLGNKSDLDESDLIEYLLDDPSTKVIMLYIEGVQNGERLVEVLNRATRTKPVIVIKSGRSKRGAMAAASHTGSLAGSDAVFEKVMRQCGVMRAETIDEAFNWCKFLSACPLPKGENVVIVTNGGGIGVMATDACEKYDVNLLEDPALMHEVFRQAVPDYGSIKNPIDITGGARTQDYDTAFSAGLKTDRIDAVIALYCETAMFDVDNLERMVEENFRLYTKKGIPITFSLLGGEKVEKVLNGLREKGVPAFADVYECVQSLGALYKHYRRMNAPVERTDTYKFDLPSVEGLVSRVRADGRTFLLANEAQELMALLDIPMPRNSVARNLEEAIKAAEVIGYPVVMKVVSKDIIHKSDAGGVALDLENRDEVVDAYQAIIRSCRRYNPDALIEGVEVCEQISLKNETIVGARLDANFGPVIMFGMGGIYVEVLKDVSFRALPVNRKEILRLIKETKAYTLLLGVRGDSQKDIEKVIDTVIKVGSLIMDCRSMSDIEINPLVAFDQGKGVKAIDVRVLLNKDRGL
ncbi:MAG: acetate--CoA ligase family protein [Candidatus Thermoplasmatota archaeon]|jgi:acetyltransferase|nr:acetate--CoA ligase family protein [Candidatus Thermoplasmatota archaeon]